MPIDMRKLTWMQDLFVKTETLQKPIDVEQLLRILQKFTRPATAG